MFGLGPTELIIILALALIIFGPRKLPEIAREVGKAINSLKNASQGIEESVKKEVLGEGNNEKEEVAPAPDTTLTPRERAARKKAKKAKSEKSEKPEVE